MLIWLVKQVIRYLRLVDLVLLTLVMYFLAWLPKPLTAKFYFKLFRFWSARFADALGVQLRLKQQNVNPLPDHYLLIANHPSAFEDIGVPALFNVHSLAKIQVKDWFFFGRISEAAETLYVDRDDKGSRSAAKQVIIDALNSGKNVALYPEGGCKGRRIAPQFHYGAFDIAIKTNTPILPVLLHYHAQDDFEWREPYTLVQMMWRIFNASSPVADFIVFDAIDPAEFDSAEAFCAHMHHKYLQWQSRYLGHDA